MKSRYNFICASIHLQFDVEQYEILIKLQCKNVSRHLDLHTVLRKCILNSDSILS